MHKLAPRVAFVLTATTVLLGVALSVTVPKAAAETSAQTTASVMVSSSCSLTADEETPHTATLANGVYSGGTGLYPNGIGKTILTAFCNNAAGFAIYAVGYSGSPGAYGNNTMIGTATGIPIGTGTATTGGDSQWAMKVNKVNDATAYNPENLTITNGFDDYHAVPSVYEKVADFSSNTDATLGSKMTTTYAVYISPTQAADTYVGKVKYTLVHPQAAMAPSLLSEYGITYMQDFVKLTPGQLTEVKNAMVTGEKAMLTDIRDGNIYYVAKLADGNIWLLDNLALDLTDHLVVDALSSSNTNAADASLDHLRNGGGTTSDKYPIIGLNYSGSSAGSSFDAPRVNTTYKDVFVEAESLDNTEWKYGIYYNYCAASAGSYCYGSNVATGGNLSEDICPKGWHIPSTRANGQLSGGEFYELYYNYGYGTPSSLRKALRLPYSGSDSGNRGTSGVWWTSTNYSSEMYDLVINNNGVNHSIHTTRNNGMPVRCILDTSHVQTIANIEYMQDVTSEIVANTPSYTTATMIDKRDGTKYTVGKLRDGRLWLLDNLALDMTSPTVVNAMNSTNTNASDTALYHLKNGGGTTSDQYPTMPLLYADWTANYNRYSIPLLNTSYMNSTNTEDTFDGATAWKFGIYYNFCAATAGSYCYGDDSNYGTSVGDASEDICPRGWRLPNGQDNQTLYNGYGNYSAFRAALRLPLSGLFNTGQLYRRGQYGQWWSSRRYDDEKMRYMLIIASSADPNYYSASRYEGFAVRCIFGT